MEHDTIRTGAVERTTPLYTHKPRPHGVLNANLRHKEHIEAVQAESLNMRVAVSMTKVFQSMWTFWLILAWIVLWILCNAVFPVAWDRMPWPLLLCLASVPQLPLMIVIMVGQGLLGSHAEMQSNEAFKTTMNSYHDIEQVMHHLDAQDEKILDILRALQGTASPPLLPSTIVTQGLAELRRKEDMQP